MARLIKIGGGLIGLAIFGIVLALIFQISRDLGVIVGGVIVGLLLGIILAGISYIIGVSIAAQGQHLRASLDAAVNSSPLLDNELRVRIMSLK